MSMKSIFASLALLLLSCTTATGPDTSGNAEIPPPPVMECPPAGCPCPVPSYAQCLDPEYQATTCGRQREATDRAFLTSLGVNLNTLSGINTALARIPAKSCQRRWGDLVCATRPSGSTYVAGTCFRERYEASQAQYASAPKETLTQTSTSAFPMSGSAGVPVYSVARGQAQEVIINRPEVDDLSVPAFNKYSDIREYRASRRNWTIGWDRSTWNSSGNAVDSCEEYVYEKYFDYSEFYLASRGQSNRDVFNIAFGRFPSAAPESVGYWPPTARRAAVATLSGGRLLGRDSTDFGGFRATTESRNRLSDWQIRFYAQRILESATCNPWPWGFCVPPISISADDDRRLRAILALPEETTLTNFTWHQNQSNNLANAPRFVPVTLTRADGTTQLRNSGYFDHELDELDLVQEKMWQLTQSSGVQSVFYGVGSVASTPYVDFLSMLGSLDQAGCIRTATNACDWSPRRFVNSVFRPEEVGYVSPLVVNGTYQDIRRVMERDFQRCTSNVPDPWDFGVGWDPSSGLKNLSPPTNVRWAFDAYGQRGLWNPSGTSSVVTLTGGGQQVTGTEFLPDKGSVFGINYTGSPSTLEQYFREKERFASRLSFLAGVNGRNNALRRVANIPGASIGPDGRVVLAGINSELRRSGGDTIGNEYLGIKYDYSYTQTSQTVGLCNASPNVTGSFNSQVMFLTSVSPFISAEGQWNAARSTGDDAQAKLRLRVFGISVFDANDPSASSSGVSNGTVRVRPSGDSGGSLLNFTVNASGITASMSLDPLLARFCSTAGGVTICPHKVSISVGQNIPFSILGIPFYFSLRAVGQLGINVEFRIHIGPNQDGCNGLELGVTFEPFISSSVVATLAVGVEGFLSAGIRARITLFDFRVPIDVGVGIYDRGVTAGLSSAELATLGDSSTTYMAVTLKGSLRGKIFAASLALFAEFLFWDVEYELASFPGIDLGPLLGTNVGADGTILNLLNYRWVIPTGDIAALQGL